MPSLNPVRFLKKSLFQQREESELQKEAALRKDVRESIESGAVVGQAYVVMNGLATVVASYGLLANSGAVVIGAMVIATLLGPITGIALALVDGNFVLLRRALIAEALGVALVLGASVAIGRIHSDMPLTQEILSRTQPNILDLMIALAGGAAGAYATVSPRVSAGLVGVAIATALVPPLATSGICLARGDLGLAWGGFLLFFTNFVAIQFATSAVMWILGFHKVSVRQEAKFSSFLKHNAVSISLLLFLIWGLWRTFHFSIVERSYRSEVEDRLKMAMAKYPGVELTGVDYQLRDGTQVIVGVIRTPYSFAPNRVSEIQATLPRKYGREPELHIRSVLVKETSATGYLHEQPAQEPATPTGPVETIVPNTP